MIKSVVFDMGGVIHTQSYPDKCKLEFAENLLAFLAVNNILINDTPEKFDEKLQRGGKLYKKHEETEKVELQAERIWADFFLKEYGVEANKLLSIGEELCFLYDSSRPIITPRVGLKETMEGLKAIGMRLGIITNIMSKTYTTYALKKYGIDQYFEHIIQSSECGIRKPDKRIFELYERDMGLSKNECAYVGDTISRDVIGVRNANWEMIILIDNPLIAAKDEKYKNSGYAADYEIKNLFEVVEIIKEYNQKF